MKMMSFLKMVLNNGIRKLVKSATGSGGFEPCHKVWSLQIDLHIVVQLIGFKYWAYQPDTKKAD